MTDSEDQDWASTSEDEVEKVEHRHERQRLSYTQMNDLGFVLAAAVLLKIYLHCMLHVGLFFLVEQQRRAVFGDFARAES